MQYLEDMGQVRSQQSAERRVYHLTEAGWAELDARAEDLQAFWSPLAGPPASAAAQRHPEIDFLAEELDALGRTAWGGLRGALDRNDLETVRRVRQTIERCRGEVRHIIAEGVSRTGQA
jgi:DNA-binding PadR family transcriptional regulator